VSLFTLSCGHDNKSFGFIHTLHLFLKVFLTYKNTLNCAGQARQLRKRIIKECRQSSGEKFLLHHLLYVRHITLKLCCVTEGQAMRLGCDANKKGYEGRCQLDDNQLSEVYCAT
jgi:hypothetical protein